VLQTVNSPYYGLRSKILDYYRACLLLGFNNIYRLVLDRSLQGIMPDTGEFRAINQHSYIVSVFAQQIAMLSGKIAAPTAATIGLLHDLGKSALLLWQQHHPKLATSFALLDPSAIGSSLLESWELPPAIVKVIGLQGWSAFAPPERLPQEHASPISVLHLAHACSDLLNGNENATEPVFTSEYLAALGFPGLSLRDFYIEKVHPGLLKDQKGLPEPIRKILFVRTADTEEELPAR
jgi:HD-like signal output (HDOD) protein